MLRREDPKNAKKYGSRGVWTEEAAALRADPGSWYLIEAGTATDAKSRRRPYGLAGHIRSGGYIAFRPKGAFEAKVEYDGDDFKVYVRFVGEPTPAPEAGHDSGGPVSGTPAPAKGRRTVVVSAA
jgi:hypothetical protein